MAALFTERARVQQVQDQCQHSLSLCGTVYGVAFEAGKPIESVGENRAGTPGSSVLYIKTPNTYLPGGGEVRLPPGLAGVEASATLGVVFAADTTRVHGDDAFRTVAGYTLAIDLTQPGAGVFRPPVREKCRDGFLPISSTVVEIDIVRALPVRLEVDGSETAVLEIEDARNRIGALIAEITAFITFRRGDILLALRTPPALVPQGGQIAAVSAGLGRLECTLVPE